MLPSLLQRGEPIAVNLIKVKTPLILSVVDAQGRKRFTASVVGKTEILIKEDLAAGIYIVLLETEKKVFFRKIIVQ